MDQNARKATDVLISLESKIDILINLYKTQDYNIKILSNKLNLLLDQLAKNASRPPVAPLSPPQIIVEAADVAPPNKQVKISAENAIAVATNITGQRRTSRPETYEDFEEINAPQKQEKIEIPKNKVDSGRTIQVTQRVIDKSNNSIFLAEVDVKSIDSDATVHKTRTNGVGKWVGTLPAGKYRVTIRKRQANGKSLEVMQDIDVAGNLSPIELPDLIVK